LANTNKKAAQMTAKLRSQEGEVLHSKGGASNTELGIFHSKKNVKQKFATNENPPTKRCSISGLSLHGKQSD
jgi:hypothetical protein